MQRPEVRCCHIVIIHLRSNDSVFFAEMETSRSLRGDRRSLKLLALRQSFSYNQVQRSFSTKLIIPFFVFYIKRQL